MLLANFCALGATQKEGFISNSVNQLYYYETDTLNNETIEDCLGNNFFNPIYDRVKLNDFILVYSPNEESNYCWLKVINNIGGIVSVERAKLSPEDINGLDDIYVNVDGDTMTGNLGFIAGKGLHFEDNTKTLDIKANGNILEFNSNVSGQGIRYNFETTTIYPATDLSGSLGIGGRRWNMVGTGSLINSGAFCYVPNPTSNDTLALLNQDIAPIQAEIDHLESIGRFLSFWDCTTGLPETEPQTSPYIYQTGDYFRVGVVGATNYKPNGSSYISGVPSTTIETGTVQVGQVYYYDGTNWNLAAGGGTPEVDETTIDFNNNNELQTIGIIDDNTGNADKIWSGTYSEYEDIASKDNNTIYYTERGIYKGSNLIAGGSNTTPLLSFIWADHLLSDISWLRADTFSWQSGSVYTSVYNHLVEDLVNATASIETIGSYSITVYTAEDGHKICLDDMESTLIDIYNETGIAWYYIVDTTNTRFKLPRTKYGFNGLRTGVGNFIDESLPNITGRMYGLSTANTGNIDSNAILEGCFERDTSISNARNIQSYSTYNSNATRFDASLSSSVYQDNASVQPKSTEMYLYFYVGQFTQSAVEQTAGLNAELFNDKADLDLGNVLNNIDFVVASQLPTAENNYTWYRKYKSGWVEQGGEFSGQTSIVFPIEMADTHYEFLTGLTTLSGTQSFNYNTHRGTVGQSTNRTTTGISGITIGASIVWRVSGMSATE